MSIGTTGNWLPLLEYSAKYEVSESFLHRSIDAKEINFRFEDGKYFIMDAVGTHQRVHRPSQKSDLALVGAHQGMVKDIGTVSSSYLNSEIDVQDCSKLAKAKKNEPIINTANKLLYELKKVYSQILQEKDEQLLQLKQEVAELKTLVSLLESENEKLKFKR